MLQVDLLQLYIRCQMIVATVLSITNTQPGGITPILLNESLSQNFYIPEVFPDLELYIERTNTADRDATVSSLVLNL